MVLQLRPPEYTGVRLKAVIEVLDETPVLDPGQIRLGIWMRQHLYCTFFDCLRLMLPSGLWFKRRKYILCFENPMRHWPIPIFGKSWRCSPIAILSAR